jgi:hypothetical protein
VLIGPFRSQAVAILRSYKSTVARVEVCSASDSKKDLTVSFAIDH